MNIMHYNYQTVLDLLANASRRATFIALAARRRDLPVVIALVLLLTGWAAHRYRYNTSALIVLRIGALLTVLATIYFALVRSTA